MGDQVDTLNGKSHGVLQVVSAENGDALVEYKLDAPPVWDGMAVGYGKLFIATMDGKVMCLGSRD